MMTAIFALQLGLTNVLPTDCCEAADDLLAKPEVFEYNPKGHRDPFMPLVRNGAIVGTAAATASTQTTGSRTKAATPVLYGILWDPGGNSIALIDDAELRVGGTIGGYRVIEIREDAVVLKNGGEPVVLTISFEAPPPALGSGTKTGGKDR